MSGCQHTLSPVDDDLYECTTCHHRYKQEGCWLRPVVEHRRRGIWLAAGRYRIDCSCGDWRSNGYLHPGDAAAAWLEHRDEASR